MDKYLITNDTLVVMPYEGDKTKIVEKYVTYIINDLPLNIINKSCLYYGSSYKGRCDASEYMIGIKYKCPIIISEIKDILFFPTTSVKNPGCIWFNYKSVSKYYYNNKQLFVEIINGEKIIVDISNYTFSNQILKTSRLDSILKSKYAQMKS